jgi:hypothetical protein
MAEVLPEGVEEFDGTRAAFAAWLALLVPYFEKVIENLEPGLLLVVPTGCLADVDTGELQVSSLGDAESSLGDAESSLGGAESLLGDAESSLGDAESSLGDAESSLGDAESSLGDAESSLGEC